MRQFLTTLLFVSAAAAIAGDSAINPKTIDSLIRQLNHEDFDTREAAMKALRKCGDGIVPYLHKTLEASQDAETKARIEDLLKQWATGNTAWEFEAGYVFGTPSIVGGRVYVANKDNNFFCLDADSGKEIWRIDIGGLTFHFNCVADNRIFVIRTRKDGRKDGTLFCLNCTDGKTLWTHKFDSQNFTAPISCSSRLYLACEESLFCFDTADGTELWHFEAPDMLLSAPSISDERVVIGCLDKNLYCLDAKDGKKVWEFETGDTVTGGGAILDGRVYASSQDKHIYCLDLKTGRHCWEFATKARVYAAPAVAENKIYAGGDDGILCCLNANGDKRWEYDTDGTIFASPSVSDGRVFVSSINNKLTITCLHAESGKRLWSFENKEAGYAYPVLSGRKLFVGYHSKFYCVRSGLNGPADWPMMCGNPARTSFNDLPIANPQQ